MVGEQPGGCTCWERVQLWPCAAGLTPVKVSECLWDGRLSAGHHHERPLTSLAPDADCKIRNSTPEVISLSKGFQSNFTEGECLRLEIVFLLCSSVIEGVKGEIEGRKGWQIDKGCSLCLPLLFVIVAVEMRFRRIGAGSHARRALKCRKGAAPLP